MRTSEEAVKKSISTSLTVMQIRAFMGDANLWVTEELAEEDISEGRLEIIERYLTCALIRVRDLGLKDASLEDVSETYQVDSEVTDYLLRAASFDPTGKVRAAFLAPKPTTGTQTVPVKFRVGAGFVDPPASGAE